MARRPKNGKASKARISITLDANLLHELDKRTLNRSEYIETLLFLDLLTPKGGKKK